MVDVGVVEHEHRGLPAQLQGRRLRQLRGLHGQQLPDAGGAGEGDLADHRARDEPARQLGRIAVEHVEHACRQPGVGQGLREQQAGQRRFLRGLDDAAAAGGQRGRDLVARIARGEVPGGERRHRPDRLTDHLLLQVFRARRHQPPVGAPRLLGEPFEHVRRDLPFAARLGQRLAFLQGQDARVLVHPFAHQGRGPAEHDPAFDRRYAAPQPEAAPGRLQCGIDIVHRRRAIARQRLARGGIDDRAFPVACAGPPCAVDEEGGSTQEFGKQVHGGSHGIVGRLR